MSFIQQLQTFSGNAPLSRRQALLGLSLLALTACSRSSDSKTSNSKVAYYTCTMHLFVRSQDPKGKCPVCGMDLVAVSSPSTTTTAAPDAHGMVNITPERMREIGVTTEVVSRRTLPRSPHSIERTKVIAISANAVLPTGNAFIVFVDHGGGKLEPREIEVGVQTEDNYEVLSGLKEGDRVVSSANFLIDAESRIQGVLKTWGDRP
jgi:hypothetical protein